ncbi:hypothetical protein BHE74_00024709 [Ensete ventricosum]|uniref:Uncharacterized protein n=1 Tax=Ensete ventricosum TaxID=4639 RepID=A0A426ZXT1_ENSVE|nr:hypothetical protein B296_00006020 [Ensete ventricosum]RWW67818.1 hypothetical protein BHE74_00024709 [Ensete ventricosum]RZS02310.1 hypothetical protein BHM03_00032344 [Ensete ventricosum]
MRTRSSAPLPAAPAGGGLHVMLAAVVSSLLLPLREDLATKSPNYIADTKTRAFSRPTTHTPLSTQCLKDEEQKHKDEVTHMGNRRRERLPAKDKQA